MQRPNRLSKRNRLPGLAMTEVLDQSDIDALLTAVNTGEVAPPSDAPMIFSRFRRGMDQVEIREYDFKRPERISKDQMRALQTLHETFARNYGASLSGFLRTIVEVRVDHAAQMTYSEFTSSLPNPTSFNLVTADELDGQLCLELSPLIIYPIIDRLLGGSNQDLFVPQRAMTLIETRLIQKILDRAMAALTEAWDGIRKIEFKLGDMESNPQIVQIVPPNEVVVVIGFEIRMTNRAGTMSLCIPFNAIEPIIDDLSAQSWFLAGRHRGEAEWGRHIANRLADAPLEMTGILAETTMTMNELRHLEVGDLLMTEKPAKNPVVLAAGGVPKFLAHIGQYKGRRALKVLRAVTPADRV
ncbi:MAG TPA: flagellar motor switch protein FliM [Phycisphaerales bacterium]|nr:flagellar motor switch protein FliM [Phycisphaerales bacterium]HRQ74880.1 flagellar motor switch protein FliM [Phycisphaerales bacterium]